jgi:hypothetical protein
MQNQMLNVMPARTLALCCTVTHKPPWPSQHLHLACLRYARHHLLRLPAPRGFRQLAWPEAIYESWPQFVILTSFFVWPPWLPNDSIFFTTSLPSTTWPKTTCLPSSHGVATVVRKNCTAARARVTRRISVSALRKICLSPDRPVQAALSRRAEALETRELPALRAVRRCCTLPAALRRRVGDAAARAPHRSSTRASVQRSPTHVYRHSAAPRCAACAWFVAVHAYRCRESRMRPARACEPLVFGPALAIDSRKGLSCFTGKPSSLNFSP